MGSYKAYLDLGLDLCPKIYVQEDPDCRTQHADHPEPPDDVSGQIASNPTDTCQDTDYITSSSIPTRASQDTESALTTPSSNRTHASKDIQFTSDIISVSSSKPTRPSQDKQLARSTPTDSSSHASQGDLTASSNNRTPSIPRSDSLPSHPTYPTEPQPSQTNRLNPKDREPSPQPTPSQPHAPCPPCAKRLWSKVIRAPAPESPSPRTPGLWTKVLCSSTTPPPAPAPAPETTELEPPRRHGLFSRRRRSSVPLVDLPPSADLQQRVIGDERRLSSPILVNVRSETWPPRSSRQRSHDPPSPNHPDPDLPTTTPIPQRRTRSSSQNDQTPIYAPPIQEPLSPPSVYSTPYSAPHPPNPLHHEDTPSLLSLQHHLNYTFTNPTLLSEALTPPTAGHSNNARLSYLGRRAMELVLWESYYALRLSERAAREAVARALGVEALVGAGMRCGLGRFVGGGEADLATEVRRGVLAVVGGVYLDGGVGEVRRVMGGLGVGVEDG